MRKIYFKYFTGYCGMDSAEVVEYPDSVTDKILDEDAWQGALNNAEAHGIYPSEEYSNVGDEDQYSDNIEGYWEEYNPEKHDGSL